MLVDNSAVINRHTGTGMQMLITNVVMKLLYKSFPQFIGEKRYKLINFARVTYKMWITYLSRLKSTGRYKTILLATRPVMWITKIHANRSKSYQHINIVLYSYYFFFFKNKKRDI